MDAKHIRVVFLFNLFLIYTGANQIVLKQEAENLIAALDRTLNFVNYFLYDMNLDATLGIVLAESNLRGILKYVDQTWEDAIKLLIEKCYVTTWILELIPRDSKKTVLYINYLINWHAWISNITFQDGELQNLGFYQWTIADILRNRSANYNGVSSDECFTEILRQTPYDLHLHKCTVSARCALMMFEDRIDTGYVLTHRLLYLQIMERMGCNLNRLAIANLKRRYCSLILKELKTNEVLGFPQRDIFLEQVVLCGMEGYKEIFNNYWRKKIIKWQTQEGCFKNSTSSIRSVFDYRSANIINFGCSDHTTGLGAATLAIQLRFILAQFKK